MNTNGNANDLQIIPLPFLGEAQEVYQYDMHHLYDHGSRLTGESMRRIMDVLEKEPKQGLVNIPEPLS